MKPVNDRKVRTHYDGKTETISQDTLHKEIKILFQNLVGVIVIRLHRISVYKLNFLLPGDIAVGSMTPVDDGAHARFAAREREYRYYIEPRKNPFTRGTTWQYYVPLDVGRMNEAAAWLLCYDDFTSFAKLNSNNKTNICRVMHASWTADGQGVLCFTIRADRFLRNMVRSLVGTLVDVGRGRYTPQQFREIVESRDLSRSSGGAPAQGLFLSDVVYPADVFERKVFY